MIKRYNCETYTRSWYEESWEETEMIEREEGEYVKYDDIKHLLNPDNSLLGKSKKRLTALN